LGFKPANGLYYVVLVEKRKGSEKRTVMKLLLGEIQD
jgi:hypothetical protein